MAKKVAIYFAKKLTALKNAEIGERFGITYSAVSKAMTDVERLTVENRKVKHDADWLISHFKG